MKNLVINGELKSTDTTGLSALFAELGLPAALLLVEYNGKALVRSEWEKIRLCDGDRLELLSVTAGG